MQLLDTGLITINPGAKPEICFINLEWDIYWMQLTVWLHRRPVKQKIITCKRKFVLVPWRHVISSTQIEKSFSRSVRLLVSSWFFNALWFMQLPWHLRRKEWKQISVCTDCNSTCWDIYGRGNREGREWERQEIWTLNGEGSVSSINHLNYL